MFQSKPKKNLLFIGKNEKYQLLKVWIKENKKTQFVLRNISESIKNNRIQKESISKYFPDNLSNQILIIDASNLNPDLVISSINWAEEKGARIHLIQDSVHKIERKFENKNKFGPFIVIPLRKEPLSRRKNRFKKSLLDYLISLSVIFGIFWWIYPIVFMLIKLTSKGPVIIKQKRIGINGNQFSCLKFRTMTFDRKARGASYYTKKNDNRVTWIGKILRNTNLDELPQFINVLRGDMSVIGPRPHLVEEDKDIADKIKSYRIRRFVKPGITGLAAIKGYRGGTANLDLMQKRIDYDIQYIEKWNLLLDIKIALYTLIKMVTMRTDAH